MLVRHGFAVGHPVGADAISGDVAESWEVTPDATQITFKLRPDIKLDPRPPTTGRFVNAGDLKYSMDKAAQVSPYRTNVFNSASDAAPVTSVTMPDDRTIVIKMAFPYAPVLEMLAHNQHPLVVPVEA